MLKRREFLKLSALLAAGAVITVSGVDAVAAITFEPQSAIEHRPLYRFHGHARSGCAFRPELTDMWAGGGAVLPENL